MLDVNEEDAQNLFYLNPLNIVNNYKYLYVILDKHLHSDKSLARPMLFYSTHYWHQF